MRRMRAKPAAHHNLTTPFIYKDLQVATHVFLRDDTVRRPFQPPYLGPYEVLARPNRRLYTILVNDRPSNISIERLKPAYLPAEEAEVSTTGPSKPTETSPSTYPLTKRVTFQEN
ncbi:gag-pol protein [Lasius niger]|uniref:Gag-pol protein n=1 Tax=Lasius niger TaxID=67767 RepID=A0A0J7N0G0_LASNI|nr:gag-pol protein [Lasius niger]